MDRHGSARPQRVRRLLFQSVVQIDAMRVPQIGAVTLVVLGMRHGHRGRLGHRVLELDRASFDEASGLGVETPADKEACDIGRDVYGGAHFVVHRGSLVDVHLVARATKRDSGGEARDACSDDDDVKHGWVMMKGRKYEDGV